MKFDKKIEESVTILLWVAIGFVILVISLPIVNYFFTN
jgi:hypothetical protein